MGRPPSGVTPLMGFRADTTTRAAIVKWAEYQPDQPTLSEAIRRLVEIGLFYGVIPSPKRRSKQSTARAAELAEKVIDKQIAPGTPTEERAIRKRKLLHGPSIVREARKDRLK